MTRTYELVNDEGCTMFGKKEFISDKEAYDYCKQNYTGKYRLLKSDEYGTTERKVNLK